MVFTSDIEGKMQGSPMQQGLPIAFRTEWVIGVWDGAAVTTGDIDLECDSVLMFIPTIVSATPTTPVQVELDTDGSGAKAGWVNLNFTSGKGGSFLALVMHRR